MTTFILDTLDYATKLKAGGFSEQQAETQARALAEILDRLDRQITTKSEVAEHEDHLRREIREAELRLEAKLAETNARIAKAKAELTRWVVGAGVLQTALIIGVLLKVGKLI
jgi:hypothetical protein